MYNISELDEMADSDLKAVAESMGIKKIDLSKKEELIYSILDQQAIDRAASSTAENKRRNKLQKELCLCAQTEVLLFAQLLPVI